MTTARLAHGARPGTLARGRAGHWRPHQLRAVASLLPEQTERRDANGRVSIVAAWVEEALSAGRRVVVLATGDPLYFGGIAAGLIAALGHERVQVVPTLSSVQLAAARLGLPWQDAKLVSVMPPMPASGCPVPATITA